MDDDGFRHRGSPRERFLDVFSSAARDRTDGGDTTLGVELHEDEVFWTGGDADLVRGATSSASRAAPSPASASSSSSTRNRRETNRGILAALAVEGETAGSPRFFARPHVPASHHSPSSSRGGLAIPAAAAAARPNRAEYAARHQSAPVRVPAVRERARRRAAAAEGPYEDGDADDEEMLPPHEVVARKEGPMTSFSVLEGAGRTLKGRDLRRVRNAVWRQTGFLDSN